MKYMRQQKIENYFPIICNCSQTIQLTKIILVSPKYEIIFGAPHNRIALSTLCYQKFRLSFVSVLYLGSWLLFYIIYSHNYRSSNFCAIVIAVFSLLKAIAKIKKGLIKYDNYT